jgi:YVTN family beta-propeller protein
VHPFRVDTSAHRLYVVNSGSSSLSIVDTGSLRVIRTLRTGRYPEGLDVQPGRNRAYVSNEGDPGTDKNSGHTASVIDLRSGRIVDMLPTLQGPDGIACDPRTGSIYISNEDPGRVSVIGLPPRDR